MSREKVPEECPLLKECKNLMYEHDYEILCSTEAWIYCDSAESEAVKYMKKPSEWKKLRGGSE